MNMRTAVLQGFERTFSWQGRASRPAYWFFVLHSLLWYVLCGFVAAEFDTPVFLIAWLVIVAVPTMGVAVRWLHDTDRSGWWLPLSAVPFGFIVLLVFFCQPGTHGHNHYGPPPAP